MEEENCFKINLKDGNFMYLCKDEPFDIQKEKIYKMYDLITQNEDGLKLVSVVKKTESLQHLFYN